MNKRRFSALLSLFVLFCACQGKGKGGESGQEVAQDSQTLYKIHCVACHGLQGDMGAAGAANLRSSKLSLEERIVIITKGRNAMQSYEQLLSAEQIQEIATYTLQLADTIN